MYVCVKVHVSRNVMGIASVYMTFSLLCSIPFYEGLFHCNFYVEFIFANFMQI